MLVTLPALAMGDLMQRLSDGEIPFTVHADEINVLAPGVEIHDWSASEDRMYYLASQPSGGFGGPLNADPGPGPFAPGQEFSVAFLEFLDDAPSVFDAFEPGARFYLVEDPDAPLVNVPAAYDRMRVVAAERLDGADDGITLWLTTLERTDTESLPEIYATASFCTGTDTHIDLPVQESRLAYRDNHAADPEASDGKPQGIRFNDLPFANGLVKLSGQVEGHVLKPSLSFRIRDGRVSTIADFDTDFALTAELRAEDSASFDPEDVSLWSLCFPLPEFSAGPVSIPMNLQLVHTVGVEADVQAGAVVGFEKHFDSGFTITCESGGGAGSSCDSHGHRAETPIEFTPPRLTDDTAAHARIHTTLEGSLNFFSPYPLCDAGPGVFLDTTAYGTLDVTPTQDPWWNVSYGLDVSAGVELDLLGVDIARFDTDLFSPTDDGPDSGVGGPRSSGEDQRWAVAIDDTSVPNGVSAAKITALPDGSSVAIASEAIGARTPLVKLDRYGAMQWVKEFGSRVPTRVRALPDGTLIVVGTNSWLARVDADGNLLWSLDADVARADVATAHCLARDVAVLEQSPGHYDYVVVGRMGAIAVSGYDACALRVNEDGTIPWTRVYGLGAGNQHFFGATAMRDGNVMAVGVDSWYWGGP
ncbi:MAG TPA: hypothetical protein VMX12_01070, partial [Acidimicrobiia bacterium]|nr:hypothetical protein [Acidimicrobiia bacterium]